MKVRKRTKAVISRGELRAMHAEALALSKHGIAGAYSLVCSLGACLGNWPRVRAKMAKELRERFTALVNVRYRGGNP